MTQSGRFALARFSFFAVIALGALAAQCAQSSAPLVPQPPERESSFSASPNPHIRLFANVLKDAVWRNPRVFVCWENLTTSYSQQAAWVREAIGSTWERESAVRFAGWQSCATENAGIRVRVEDVGPHTKGLGAYLDRRRDGMVLNFAFKNWSPTCLGMKESCIRSIAVHEFGHALGFAHEQNRFDAPGECQAIRQGQQGDLLLTPYDLQSVMNYCNSRYNNGGVLSALDIAAVRELYGGPREQAGGE